MLIGNWSDLKETEPHPGVFRQVYTSGGLQVVRYRYAPGSVYPTHSHPQEQMTIVLRGRLTFDVDGAAQEVGEGDVVFIPGGVPHGAVTPEDGEALTLNFFSSPKEGFR